MSALRAAFVIIYLTLLVLYFFSETSGNFRRRAVNKIVMAALFLLYAAAAFLRRYPPTDFRLLLVIGLAFSFVGDVLLLWDFVRGGVFFNLGNYILLTFEIVLAFRLGLSPALLWPAAAVFVLCWGTMMTLFRLRVISYGSVRIFPEYLMSVSLHGSLGLAMALARPTVGMFLLGTGLFLFMLSDYFMTFHKFKCHADWVLRCNSGFYFTGMLLAALSLSYSF